MRLREDDVRLLLPSFQPYVYELVRRLRADGYDPCVRDTLRTKAEAANYARLGTGSARSIHCDGAAADLICQEHHWECAGHGCDFFKALGQHARALGLWWGGDWKTRVDRPHVQAVPATVWAQNRLRWLKTWEAKDAFVRGYLKVAL